MDQSIDIHVKFILFAIDVKELIKFFSRFLIHLLIFGFNYFRNEQLTAYLQTLPIQIWILVIIWPFILIVINEIYKVFEIR